MGSFRMRGPGSAFLIHGFTIDAHVGSLVSLANIYLGCLSYPLLLSQEPRLEAFGL